MKFGFALLFILFGDAQGVWAQYITPAVVYFSAYYIPVDPFIPVQSDKPLKDASRSVENLYLVLSGIIALKDGHVMEGRCFINKETVRSVPYRKTTYLSGDDHLVKIQEITGRVKTLKLSEVYGITTCDALYLCSQSEILKSVYKSEKISLYQKIFPSEQDIFKYQKGYDEPESPPSSDSTVKWQKAFFADCQALVEKIEAKELKEPLGIVAFYNEQCE